MKIHHVRNATVLVSIGQHAILVDPMLSEASALPGFRLVGGNRRRNPLVQLPANAAEVFDRADCVLVTHEHPDHLDKPGVDWIKSRGLPVWASSVDAPNLAKKGLHAKALPNEEFDIPVEVVPGTHGHGIIGWLMGPVSAFYFACPGEPTIYLTGDTVWTGRIRESIVRLQPDVVVAPAGAANFGLGSDLLFGIDELIAMAKIAPGKIVFNHLEAIDHCPTSGDELRQRMDKEGIGDRVIIPLNGEEITLERHPDAKCIPPSDSFPKSPGFQKWLTSKFAGT